MNKHITKVGEIPDSPYYVVCTDTFMSGWGQARDKDNVLIFTAGGYATAVKLRDKLLSRSEMKRVRINSTKPRIKSHWFAQVFIPEKNPLWYKEWDDGKQD